MILYVGGTARGTLPAIVDPTDGITPVTPSDLTALVIREGVNTADSVTITAVGGGRVGVYRWSYTPAEAFEGEMISIVFTITIAGSPYYCTIDIQVAATIALALSDPDTLKKFATIDTGESDAVGGSVADLSKDGATVRYIGRLNWVSE
jgi:hypothetical protein